VERASLFVLGGCSTVVSYYSVVEVVCSVKGGSILLERNLCIDRFPSPLSPPREGDITIMQKALDFTRDKPTLRAIPGISWVI
jgi:hypothetical protein